TGGGGRPTPWRTTSACPACRRRWRPSTPPCGGGSRGRRHPVGGVRQSSALPPRKAWPPAAGDRKARGPAARRGPLPLLPLDGVAPVIADRLQERLDDVRRTLREQLDAAVGEVADPAGHRVALGDADGAGPEADALDAAGVADQACDGL